MAFVELVATVKGNGRILEAAVVFEQRFGAVLTGGELEKSANVLVDVVGLLDFRVEVTAPASVEWTFTIERMGGATPLFKGTVTGSSAISDSIAI